MSEHFKRSNEGVFWNIFPTKVTEKDGKKRTNLLSFNSLCWPLTFFLIYFLSILGVETYYHEPLIKWATREGGLAWIQELTGDTERAFWSVWTEMGGGHELLFVAGVAFIWGRRSTFMYYICFIALDKIIVAYFKLAMANPRPYMIDPLIKPLKCSTSFGCPSGHSTAAALSSVVLFLDIFHGESHGLVKQRYYSTPTYIFGLICALFWQFSIPYTRLVMGVHSPNQILFGNQCGIWSGLFLHFIVRDRLILHVEKIMSQQQTNSSSQTKSLIALEETPGFSIQNDNEDGHSQPIVDAEFSARKQVIFASAFYIFYELLSMVTFHIINQIVTPTSKDFLMWSKNFTAGGCGVIDMNDSLQNACLNGCGYLTGPIFIYIFTVYRNKVMPFSGAQEIKVQDSQLFRGGNIIKMSLLRLCLFAFAGYMLNLPGKYIKLDHIGNPIIIMIINIIIPMIVCSYFLFGGVYDWILSKFS